MTPAEQGDLLEPEKPKKERKPPRLYLVPPKTRASACRSCGATVYWIRNPDGEDRPPIIVDCDPERCAGAGAVEPCAPPVLGVQESGRGVSHFATCPDAAQWSKKGTGAGHPGTASRG